MMQTDTGISTTTMNKNMLATRKSIIKIEIVRNITNLIFTISIGNLDTSTMNLILNLRQVTMIIVIILALRRRITRNMIDEISENPRFITERGRRNGGNIMKQKVKMKKLIMITMKDNFKGVINSTIIIINARNGKMTRR